MKNGLYKVEFVTPLGQGAGVVVLDNGLIRGGDSGLFYTGSYTLNGETFSAEIATDRHTHHKNLQSTLGVDQAILNLTGKIESDTRAAFAGTSPQAPGVSFQATLTRLCD
jgi:hypothetical protein